MTPLLQAHDSERFGGKARGLAGLLAAGLPVPPGFALDPLQLEALARGQQLEQAWARARELGPVHALRSSAADEDGAEHSFAGQHATVLGVDSAESLARAARRVLDSGANSAAYRARRGLGPPRLAAVLQLLLDPVASGVMFTRDPLDGAELRVVEASWGLGEVVVQGLVTPDSFRLAPDGRLLEARPGEKDLRIVRRGEGLKQEALPEAWWHPLCVPAAALRALCVLAPLCEQVAGGPADLEWAWDGERIFLLQCRPITTLSG
jgi:pyruvate,water dikinase